jgi:hypothetical protein
MRERLTAALVALIVSAPAYAQDAWDLAKCRASAPAGHLCTPEHLETDLALLTAREISNFLDPEGHSRELLIRRNPQMHFPNPEASLPDPRTDPTLIQLLHAWAESGVIESQAAAPRRAGDQIESNAVLKGIRNIFVMIEESDSRDATCRPTNEALRRAAIDPIVGGGLRVVSKAASSPTLSVRLTALPLGSNGCAAFLSVSLRDLPYVTPGYESPPKIVGRKVLEEGNSLTSSTAEFAPRVIDQLRRTVAGFVGEVKLASRGR